MTSHPKAQDKAVARPPKLGTTVLVAHPSGAEVLQAGLEGAGFEVVVATGAGAARQAVLSGQIRVAVIDRHFDGDGLAFCRSLVAEAPWFPVILTGPNDEDLVTTALAAGADDYLAVPLRPAELVARVRAVLRRAPVPAQGQSPRTLAVGAVRLDPESFEVSVRGRPTPLRLREFELLRLLMENAGIVLPRATLLAKLWGPSAPLEGTTLEVHIRRLRAKIEEDPKNPRCILTVRGIGYKYQP